MGRCISRRADERTRKQPSSDRDLNVPERLYPFSVLAEGEKRKTFLKHHRRSCLTDPSVLLGIGAAFQATEGCSRLVRISRRKASVFSGRFSRSVGVRRVRGCLRRAEVEPPLGATRKAKRMMIHPPHAVRDAFGVPARRRSLLPPSGPMQRDRCRDFSSRVQSRWGRVPPSPPRSSDGESARRETCPVIRSLRRVPAAGTCRR